MLHWGCELYTFSTLSRTKSLISVRCIKTEKLWSSLYGRDTIWLLGFIKISLYFNTGGAQPKEFSKFTMECLSIARLCSCHIDAVN